MKHICYTILFLLLLGVMSCKDNGFEKTESGLKYKIHTRGEDLDLRPSSGDIMLLDIIFRYKDSIIDQYKRTDIQLAQPTHTGDLWEGLAMMAKGDSMTFIIPVIQYYNNLRGSGVPDKIDSSENIYVNAKLLDFETEQNYIIRKTNEYKNRESKTLQEYLTANQIVSEPYESGLYIIWQEKGNGPKAESGKVVAVNYTGTFTDGRKFDSSYDRNQPFEFILGEGQVIKGWEEALSKMRVGDIVSLIIPSNLGYGAAGIQTSPGKYLIEPYTPLLFDVQLLDVKNVDPKKVNLKKQ